MKLAYTIKGVLFQTEKSDDAVEINVATKQNRTTVILKAKKEIKIESIELTEPYAYNPNDLVFVNGYQSWTDTKEFTVKENLKNIYKVPKFLVNKFAFDKYGDAPFKKYRKGVLHGFDYSYIRGEKPVFIGSYNSRNAYLIINHELKKNQITLEADCKITLTQGDEFTVFDYAMVYGDLDKTIEAFFPKKMEDKNIFGYTSWYNHYQNITEDIILDNLKNIDPRFDLFQIDDGYEQFVGDWLKVDKVKFPNGLEGICKQILDKNVTAGIWLAPFVAEEKSDLYKEHPDWLYKDKEGNPIKCGSNWSGFYVLDIYNENAKAYIVECLTHYKEMGFRFFKLDFLYSVGMIEREDKTRAQITEDAYQLIVDTLTDCKVLGCGAIPSNSAGKFTYLRIGPDVSLIFDDVWFMRFFHRERISTKVTLQNTIYRSIFARSLFLNDPDVFLLRDNNISLSKEQKEALATINALFGNVLMTSDNPGDYDEERKEVLTKILHINQDAKNKKYSRNGDLINISYELDGKVINKVYDTQRGVFNE
ncbi:glycoside hydrolase family 36 protein [Anaeroplasma bactoclasticum]|jgi:alpha-galactosidase|nr:glycoside hydrolase family 36 protein [Anaeroplasma bactoclasticum]